MTVATVIADLVRAGVAPDLVGRVAEAIATREAVLIPDEQANRRRERDRERARVRRNPQTSAESADKGSETKGFPKPLPKTQPPKPPSPPMGAHGSAKRRFPEFWQAYPRKIGKGAADKAYDRAIRRIGEPDPGGKIMAALEVAKRIWAKRDEPEFIPHPATWLNQDRWDDEPEESTVVTFTPPPLTPQQQADLEASRLRRANGPTPSRIAPLDALGAMGSGG